jgi:hypothetical protein
MRWIKRGLIYKVDGVCDWMQTHAQVPVADRIDDQRLRIYFGTRDRHNRTLTTYIEVQADDPQSILYVHDRPILPLGRLGRFDDCGVMPSWVIDHKGRKYFYYLGWNRGAEVDFAVRYRVANGLAISEDNGQTFQRVSEGPIMDRTMLDPIAVSTQCVLVEGSLWRTWYMSYTDWVMLNGIPEPSYHIKYGESDDGVHWNTPGIVCIHGADRRRDAIARPCVIKEHGTYRMWYCYRGSLDYRTCKDQSYRIGYAESTDGKTWTSQDERVGIERSETGWDSEMIAYPFVYQHKGRKYMLYNGNGFGSSGFGYAILDES